MLLSSDQLRLPLSPVPLLGLNDPLVIIILSFIPIRYKSFVTFPSIFSSHLSSLILATIRFVWMEARAPKFKLYPPLSVRPLIVQS